MECVSRMRSNLFVNILLLCILLPVNGFKLLSNLHKTSNLHMSTSSQLYNTNLDFKLINVFGRIAEQKALGFTSSYRDYVYSPLSLWLPNRWSRRLRVDNPDWKNLFGSETVINRQQFQDNLAKLPFKVPVECKLPTTVLEAVGKTSVTEMQLREDTVLLQSLENIFKDNYEVDDKLLDILFQKFGGTVSDGLKIDIMESRILEWGRLAGGDDPIIDYPIFESEIKKIYR